MKKVYISSIAKPFDEFFDSNRDFLNSLGETLYDKTITITFFNSEYERPIKHLRDTRFVGMRVVHDCLIEYGLGTIEDYMKATKLIKKAEFIDLICTVMRVSESQCKSFDCIPRGDKKKFNLHVRKETANHFDNVRRALDITSSSLAYLCVMLSLRSSIKVKSNYSWITNAPTEQDIYKSFKSKNEDYNSRIETYSTEVYNKYQGIMYEKEKAESKREFFLIDEDYISKLKKILSKANIILKHKSFEL